MARKTSKEAKAFKARITALDSSFDDLVTDMLATPMLHDEWEDLSNELMSVTTAMRDRSEEL